MFFACSEDIGLKKIPAEERCKVTDALNSQGNVDFHYLIFCDETGSFAPPLSFLINYIDGGEIKEAGSHDELMAKKGYYYDLYMAQYRAEQEEAAG